MIHTGNYLDVLKGQYDCLITDPPYSARCHNGQSEKRRKIEYECWDESDYARLVDWALSHVAGWIVIITDHVCWFEIDRFLRAAGRYCFAPVPIVFPGCTCRFQNDGPSSWAVYAHVSRPASLSKWRTLPGAYIQSREMESEILGQKPLDLMIQIVRDYSSPGMMVVDPCAGMGTTLRAAQILGREWEGAELDAERAEKARRRMADGFTPEMI